MKILAAFGRYIILMGKVFSRPEKWSIYYRRVISEMDQLGVGSIPLTAIISIFIGAVITIQMAITLESPFIPQFMIGYATKETMILEFSSTVIAIILAGKVGSNIASEIGTMRITEQIDALEIMGVNSANFLVLPKIVAFIGFMPVLVIFCIATSFAGGWFVAVFTDLISVSRYIYGLQALFQEWYVWYGLIKSLFFAYIIASVSSFFGYTVKGGALEVGKASTNAVVWSSILILLFDVVLTKILLQ